ncbi:MAG: tRNA pseudouridine(38-40) synthase TruA [Parachlamydiales bacterium]|nr:tRNA pseudouridine(38-40) synthase TruA [Parachlamydiales bacterium]
MQKKSLVKKYKITLSYDGTNYFGFQVQKNETTIQKVLEDALFLVLRKKTKIFGSGRTDTNVHALAQVCHFELDENFDSKNLLYSLNSVLPKDIRIYLIEEVKMDFHARFSAIGKIYHYHISLKDFEDPFKRLYSFKPFYKIDVDLLKKAAKKFIGKKDFSAFANKQTKGAAKNSPIKHLKRLDVIETEDGLRLEFEADGFLYKMVRNIVGTMLDVASEKISIDDIDKIFDSKDRKKASAPAEAKGLFLAKVIY